MQPIYVQLAHICVETCVAHIYVQPIYVASAYSVQPTYVQPMYVAHVCVAHICVAQIRVARLCVAQICSQLIQCVAHSHLVRSFAYHVQCSYMSHLKISPILIGLFCKRRVLRKPIGRCHPLFIQAGLFCEKTPLKEETLLRFWLRFWTCFFLDLDSDFCLVFFAKEPYSKRTLYPIFFDVASIITPGLRYSPAAAPGLKPLRLPHAQKQSGSCGGSICSIKESSYLTDYQARSNYHFFSKSFIQSGIFSLQRSSLIPPGFRCLLLPHWSCVMSHVTFE